MNLHTAYIPSNSNSIKELQNTNSGSSRSLLSILAYQYTNGSGMSINSIQRNLKEEEVLKTNDCPTWTYARQQTLVSHELARRRHSLQFDDNAFRKVKAELRRSGTVTGVGAMQLLNQQVVTSLSEQRREQEQTMQKKTSSRRTRSASI